MTGIEQNQGNNAKDLNVLRRIVQSLDLCCGRNQEIQKISNNSSDPTHVVLNNFRPEGYRTVLLIKLLSILS